MNKTQRHCVQAVAACGMLGVLLFGVGAVGAAPLDGQKLAFDRRKGNCIGCHVIAGGDSPGNVGPELKDMKKRFPDRNELLAIISDETKRNPLTVMPPFKRNLLLTEQEIEAIVDFIYAR